MIRRVVKIVFFFVLIFSFLINAQDQDVQSWNNIDLSYKPISNLELTINNGFRFAEDVSEISRYFIDFNVKRKHNKILSYSVGYRYLFDFNRSDNEISVHRKKRWYLDAYLKKGFSKKIKFSSRTRFQSQMSVTFLNHEEVINKLRQRCKLLYSFDRPNLDVFLSIEAFFIIDDDVEKLRYQIGCLKSITKRTKLSFSYMIQKQLIDSDLFFIFRTKLSHEF